MPTFRDRMTPLAIDYDILFLVISIVMRSPPLDNYLYCGWIDRIRGATKMSSAEFLRTCARVLGESDLIGSDLSTACIRCVYDVMIANSDDEKEDRMSFEMYLDHVRRYRLLHCRKVGLLPSQGNLCHIIARRQRNGSM